MMDGRQALKAQPQRARLLHQPLVWRRFRHQHWLTCPSEPSARHLRKSRSVLPASRTRTPDGRLMPNRQERILVFTR